jgi:hypothetical protein
MTYKYQVIFLYEAPGNDQRRKMVIPAGGFHFVMSFTPCLALSSDFIRREAHEMAMKRAKIFEKCYRKWPPHEKAGAKARTEKGLIALEQGLIAWEHMSDE